MPRHNKQHDARAASFKRIATGLRQRAKRIRAEGGTTAAKILVEVAREHSEEATRLRAMR